MKPKLFDFRSDLFYEEAQKVFSRYGERVPEIVVDIGAHIGEVAVTFGVNGSRFALAVEPDITNFRLLLKAVEANDCLGIVAPVFAAVTPHSFMKVPLYHGEHNSGERSLLYDPAKHSSQPVSTMSIQDVLRPVVSEFGSIDFLKIDIEGSEWDILKPSDELSELLSCVMYIDVECHRMDNKDFYKEEKRWNLADYLSLFFNLQHDELNDSLYGWYKN